MMDREMGADKVYISRDGLQSAIMYLQSDLYGGSTW